MKRDYKFSKEQNVIHVMPARSAGGDDNARIAQKRIGTTFNDDISEEIHYTLDDHLGSSNARLDDSGSIIDRQEFYPFGDTSLRTYSKKRYQYVGKEKDAESGLIYYGARYYAAWTCRFISVDPLAAQYAHLTSYNYASNSPIGQLDVDGLQNPQEGNSSRGGNPPPIDSDLAGDPSQVNPTTENTSIHTVEKGDTLSQIAADNDISVESLREANNLDPANDRKLQIGTELKLKKGDNISFNIEEPQTFQIQEEGTAILKIDEKLDFTFNDDDFWEIEPTYTKDELKILGRHGTSKGINELIGFIATNTFKNTPWGRILQFLSIDVDKKEFSYGASIPGEEIINYNMIILDIKVRGRLRTLGDGASLRAPIINFDGETIGIKFFNNKNGKIKDIDYEFEKVNSQEKWI